MTRFRLPQLGPHENVDCSGLILGELLRHGPVSDAELGLLRRVGLLVKHPRHPVSLVAELSHFYLSDIAPINQL